MATFYVRSHSPWVLEPHHLFVSHLSMNISYSSTQIYSQVCSQFTHQSTFWYTYQHTCWSLTIPGQVLNALLLIFNSKQHNSFLDFTFLQYVTSATLSQPDFISWKVSLMHTIICRLEYTVCIQIEEQLITVLKKALQQFSMFKTPVQEFKVLETVV